MRARRSPLTSPLTLPPRPRRRRPSARRISALRRRSTRPRSFVSTSAVWPAPRRQRAPFPSCPPPMPPRERPAFNWFDWTMPGSARPSRARWPSWVKNSRQRTSPSSPKAAGCTSSAATVRACFTPSITSLNYKVFTGTRRDRRASSFRRRTRSVCRRRRWWSGRDFSRAASGPGNRAPIAISTSGWPATGSTSGPSPTAKGCSSACSACASTPAATGSSNAT